MSDSPYPPGFCPACDLGVNACICDLDPVARFTARAGSRPEVVMTLAKDKVALRIGGIVRVTMDKIETEFMVAALQQMADALSDESEPTNG